ncbi:ArsR family transcriptional regulator [Methylobacterium sp. J-030]|uniref:ArsR/SmtB family transcription factor n=1 Tax=Methylobacterium sp. J-030 TaxID=2836627 RepID=UPI001FBB5E69|nr:helix-turn-helix transcriptional regulator [Methylobacterium sp. J-030]MCJ2072732.1 ArsR family transcriptional regulator [Methylobacterium sp. J-030]
MGLHPNIATAAFLIADPARSAMLMALLDGRARPAGELAYAAGVTAQTASAHLGKLRDGGLLTVERQGRHRYDRLAGPHVAEALEHLAAIRPPGEVRRKPPGQEARSLHFARCCYDHLAGQLGVAVAEALQARDLLRPAEGRRYDVTPAGVAWCAGLGLDVAALRPSRHGLAGACLDWTEREHHLAGPLATALMRAFCAQGWLRRAETGRAVQATPKGWIALRTELGLDPASCGGARAFP